MSWTDEEIDNLFQEGAKAQTFEYNNAYFSEVEAMLPVNNSGKDFLWLGTALLFIGVLTTGYFLNNTNELAGNEFATQLANVDTDKMNSKNGEFVKAPFQGSEDATVLLNESTDSNFGANQTEISTNDSLRQVGWEHSMYNVNSIVSNSQSGLSNTSTQGIQNISKPSQSTTTVSTSVMTPEMIAMAERLVEYRATNGILEQGAISEGSFLPISATLNTNAPNELDQLLDRSLIPNRLPVLSELRPKSAFYVELNAGMSQSIIIPKKNTYATYGIGVGVESHFGNFNLTTGLNFAVADHNDLKFTNYYDIPGFGAQTRFETFKYDKVYSLDIPISLGYNFGKHNLNVGVRPSILIGANVLYQDFKDGELARSENLFGLAGGLNRFGVKPTLGYAYHMNKWMIGANVGVQLIQTVNEDRIDGVNSSFPVDGQIYLRRTIRLRR